MRQREVTLHGKVFQITEHPDGTFELPLELKALRGRNVALKPAHEPIVVARKPLAGTVAQTVLEHGTGALNISGCRVEGGSYSYPNGAGGSRFKFDDAPNRPDPVESHPAGRWPANVVLSHTEGCVQVGTRKVKSQNPVMRNDQQAHGGYHGISKRKAGTELGYADPDGTETVGAWNCHPSCPVRLLDEQTGETTSGAMKREVDGYGESMFFAGRSGPGNQHGDSGGASRFFYVAKASRGERNAGLEGFEKGIINEATPPGTKGSNSPRAGAGRGGATLNVHPTVKPISLMRWLVRLVTPLEVPCSRCRGEGEVGFNPSRSFPPDPQLEQTARCPDCHGEGGVPGLVLDPFAGSGTTGCACALEGFDFVGLEREQEYVDIARARIGWWHKHRGDGEAAAVLAAGAERDAVEATGQLGMFEDIR